ncbi:MAG: hypothetical protein KF828_06850 [Anaerolineales bacterium]|nr:hypothetical protein [Anaerolineales bacterium]
MHEAKGSWNGYYRSAAGNKDQFTLRQLDEEADAAFIARIKNFSAALAQQGWKPWSSEEPGPQKPQAVAERASTAAEKSFEIETIILAAGGDHPRWTIKGGKFKKFGVTCWPEVLEAAGIAKKLNPMGENKPQGNWLAYYIERENEEGRVVPDKVTRIERKK